MRVDPLAARNQLALLRPLRFFFHNQNARVADVTSGSLSLSHYNRISRVRPGTWPTARTQTGDIYNLAYVTESRWMFQTARRRVCMYVIDKYPRSAFPSNAPRYQYGELLPDYSRLSIIRHRRRLDECWRIFASGG